MFLEADNICTFAVEQAYINQELLFKLLYAITDLDGFEYNTTIFQMAVSE